MAYETKTFVVLHELTPSGQDVYRDFLEKKADEILFRHDHPVRWFFGRLRDLF